MISPILFCDVPHRERTWFFVGVNKTILPDAGAPACRVNTKKRNEERIVSTKQLQYCIQIWVDEDETTSRYIAVRWQSWNLDFDDVGGGTISTSVIIEVLRLLQIVTQQSASKIVTFFFSHNSKTGKEQKIIANTANP